MMRQQYRTTITLQKWKNQQLPAAVSIQYKGKTNDHILGIVEENKMDFSEQQGTEKLTSNSLVLQSPAHDKQSVEVIEVGSMEKNISYKIKQNAVMTEDVRTQVQSKYK